MAGAAFVCPQVRAAIELYVALCPWPRGNDVALFRGVKGGPLAPEMIRRAMAAARAAGLPETDIAALWNTLVEASIAYELDAFDRR